MTRRRRFDPGMEPSRPRSVEGGIKAASRRGAFAEHWWAKRWIEVLEGFHQTARLARGRAYARRGQVLDITIRPGRVEALVQGSRPKPYRVEIQVAKLPESAWQDVLAAMTEEAVFRAKLLAGEMPEGIEAVFRKAGASLLPSRAGEITTACSCPDWENPCKHVAAVYYLIGEAFDRDPFLLFRLRGMEREDLIRRLGLAERDTPLVEPLTADPRAFWHGAEAEPVGLPAVRPRVLAPHLRQLGPFPFWRGREPLLELLLPVYDRASTYALMLLAGEGEATARGRTTGRSRRRDHSRKEPM